jgi:hypothetical protein
MEMPCHPQPVRSTGVQRTAGLAVEIAQIAIGGHAEPHEVEIRVARLKRVKRPRDSIDTASERMLALRHSLRYARFFLQLFDGMQLGLSANLANIHHVLMTLLRTVSFSIRSRFTAKPMPGPLGGTIVPRFVTVTAGSMMSSSQ